MDKSALKIDSVVESTEVPGRLCINGKFVVDKDSYSAMVRAELPPDVILIACVEEHFRSLILAEPDPARRNARYSEAYGLLGLIHESRGQVNHGLNDSVLELIRPWVHGKRILELGCGYGLMASAVAESVLSYTGVDASERCIEFAREKNRKYDNATFHCHPVSDSSKIEGKFDVIYSNDFLEHLHKDDLDLALAYSQKALNPGGMLIAVTSSRYFGPFDVSRTYIEPGAPARGLHLSETSYSEIIQRLKESGFARIFTPLIPLSIFLRMRSIPLIGRDIAGPADYKAWLEKSAGARRILGRAFGLRSVIVWATI